MEEKERINEDVLEDSVTKEENLMGTVVKNIYMSCDPENTDSVCVSKLIEFIKPYLLEDLHALDGLKKVLDPENTDRCVSSTLFYEAMNEWSKKISVFSESEHAFNVSRDLDNLDEKELSYIQSTPRQSFGQKLVSSKGLLHLSHIPSYNLSTTGCSDSAVLEEEVKKLEHQLSKVSDELLITKVQLTAAEEQNETLQSDLERINKRLHAESQVNELLQKDKSYSDDLRDELNAHKKKIENLNKKLLIQEKDCEYVKNLLSQSEKEKVLLEKKYESLTKKEQELKKEIIDIKAGLDSKDQEVAVLAKMNEEIKLKLREQKDLVDQYVNEKELLVHEKDSIEKTLKELMEERKKSLLVQFKNDLNDSYSGQRIGRPSTEYLVFSPQQIQLKTLKLSTDNTPPHSMLQHILNKQHLSTQLNSSVPPSSETDSPQLLDFSQEQSSEEDLFWKYKEQLKPDLDQDHESLHAEICKAESVCSSNYSLQLFEKDERMLELEEQHKSCPLIINELNDKINLLTEENKILQDNLDKLKKENSEINDKIRDSLMALVSEKIISTSTQIEDHLSTKNEMIKELVNLNRQLEIQVNTMENGLQGRINEVLLLKQQLQKDIDTQNGLWRGMQKLRMEVQTLNKEKDELTQRSNKLSEECNMLSENLKNKVEERDVLIDALKTDLTKNKNEIANLTMQNDKLKEDSKVGEKYQELFQRLNEELIGLRIEKETLIEKLKHVESSSHMLNSKCGNISRKNYDKQQLTLAKLREKIEYLESKLQSEETNTAALKKEKEELRNNVQKLSDENIDKKDLVAMLEKKLSLLKAECHDKDEKIQNTFLEIVQKEEEIKDLYKKIENNELQLKDSQEQLQQNEHTIRELTEQLSLEIAKKEEVFNMFNEKNALLELYIKEIDEKDLQLLDLKMQIQTLEEQSKNADEQFNEYKIKIKSLEDKIKTCQENQSDDSKQRELEGELILAKRNIDDCKKEFLHISKDINKIRNVVMSGSTHLKRVTLEVFDTCKKWIDISEDDNIRILCMEVEQVRNEKYSTTNIEDDLEMFNKQLQIMLSVLELMATKSFEQMDAFPSTDYSPAEGKTLNRFTLRAPKLLLSRPASPDSPSTEVEVAHAYSNNLPESTKEDCCWSKSRTILGEGLKNENNAVRISQDQLFHFNFNTLTDAVLERIDKHNYNMEKTNKENMEGLLTDLVLNLPQNVDEIQQKLLKQREFCIDEYEKYLSILRDISSRLRDHICIGASEPIKPVFVLIEELRLKLNELINSVGQYGVITYESRMANCWTLVTKYLETIKEENKPVIKKDISYFGITLRKRNKSEPAEIAEEQPENPKTEYPKRERCSCISKAVLGILLLVVFVTTLVVFIHMYCKLTSPNRVCPLDPFIVKKHLGIPPF